MNTIEEIARFVDVKERLPEKVGSYICHVEIEDGGVIYEPVSYCHFIPELGWTSQSVGGMEGKVIDWLEQANPSEFGLVKADQIKEAIIQAKIDGREEVLNNPGQWDLAKNDTGK